MVSLGSTSRRVRCRWATGPHRPSGSKGTTWVTAMLLDHKRHVLDVDLLDHPGHDREHGLQVMPTPWANIEAMVERIAVINSGGKSARSCLG